MNTPLNTLPLLAVLAVTLFLSPGLSLADNANSGHHKEKHAHDGGKSSRKGHVVGHHRSNQHRYKTHGKSHKDKDNYSYRPELHYSNGHHNKHVFYKRGHHNYVHRTYSHINYVVNDHDSNDHFNALDQLRFMIGLHSDNLDIILHD